MLTQKFLEEGRSVFTQPVALLIAEARTVAKCWLERTVANRFSDHEVEIDGMDQKKSVDWKSSDCIVVPLGLGK